jgi:DNA-binding NarL/FixJ family response regulator
MRVLIVEDHPLMLGVMARTVSRMRPEATIKLARSLEEADTVMAASGAPNFVILDLGLPDAEGPAGILHFRSVAGSAALAVMSGSVSSAAVREAYALGASAVLEKGPNIDAFEDTLRHFFDCALPLAAVPDTAARGAK